MKKIIVAILTLAMLIQLGAGMLVSADDASYKLITHWDFEGADAYADKATEGTPDALTAKGEAAVIDGVVSIPYKAGSYLVASGAEGTDLNDMAGKTILTKAKLSDEGNRKVVAAFIAKVDTFAYGIQIKDSAGKQVPYAPISYAFYNQTNDDGSKKLKNTAVNGSISLVTDEFRVFATSFAYDSATDTLTVAQYMSAKEVPEGADDFILVNTETVNAPNFKNSGDFLLGKRFGHQDSDRKLNVELDEVKIFEGVLTPEQMVVESPKTSLTPVEPLSNETRAFTVGDKFAAFIQADDANYVTIGKGGSWKLADAAGATDGKALLCETKAANASGDGITVTFTVPTDGKYYVWARTMYPNHNANSMFYSVDGEGNLIWDYPDEDDTANCYNTWHYFYMTERVAGEYSDTAKYGEWTIQNKDWRHSPKALELMAGQHTVTLTGREAGMYIDEFVITSYDISEYDPNAFEGNTDVLEVCKFCGTGVKHYVADGFAKNGTNAQTYFVNTLHSDAQSYTMEVTLPKDTEADQTESDTQPVETESDTEKETQKQLYTKATESEEETESVNDTEPAKGGCGAAVGVSALAVSAAALALAVRIKKKED